MRPRGRGAWIGLTGGIATGKSTAAGLLRARGARVIDADQVARRVVEPGRPALREIRTAFGDAVLLPDGGLDRKALGDRVFGRPEEVARLNAIVHPRVEAEVRREAEALFAAEPAAVVVYDVPLLFEAGLEEGFDLVVVVYAPREVQRERLMLRDGLTEEEVERRLASQMDIEEKARRADVVLDNRGSVGTLEAQVEALLRGVRGHNPALGG